MHRNDPAQRRDDAKAKEKKYMTKDSNVLTLQTLLGDYPNTLALKKGDVRSPELVFDFADVKVPNTAGGRAFCGPLLEQTLCKLE
jgi:hypothetical protein